MQMFKAYKREVLSQNYKKHEFIPYFEMKLTNENILFSGIKHLHIHYRIIFRAKPE